MFLSHNFWPSWLLWLDHSKRPWLGLHGWSPIVLKCVPWSSPLWSQGGLYVPSFMVLVQTPLNFVNSPCAFVKSKWMVGGLLSLHPSSLGEIFFMFLPFLFHVKSCFTFSFFIKFLSTSCVDDDPTFVRPMAWKIIKGWFTPRPLWNALIGLGIWNMYTTCAGCATHGAYRVPHTGHKMDSWHTQWHTKHLRMTLFFRWWCEETSKSHGGHQAKLLKNNGTTPSSIGKIKNHGMRGTLSEAQQTTVQF